MNICFAIGTLSYSGAEKILLNMILELNKRKYKISVILISCSEKIKDLPDSIEQYPIFDTKEERIKNKYIRIKKRKDRIKRIVEKNNFDLLISFGVKFNLDVIEACKKQKIKVILCERNAPVYDPKSFVLRLRRFISYKYAHAFVFQTNEIRDYFPKKIRNRSIVIPNFIEKYNENMYVKSKHYNSFVTCARLDNNQKSQIFLINSFAKFVKTHDNYKLEFIGDGPDKSKYLTIVKNLNISDRVIFHGNLNNPLSIISKCKCFVLTSKYEGMPNALIEAMSIGMPCISTDCSGGGAKFLINNGINGLLIDRDSENQLLNAMTAIADEKVDLDLISEEAHKINDRLKMKNIIDEWERFIIKNIKE